jgi:hypothetical protein
LGKSVEKYISNIWEEFGVCPLYYMETRVILIATLNVIPLLGNLNKANGNCCYFGLAVENAMK